MVNRGLFLPNGQTFSFLFEKMKKKQTHYQFPSSHSKNMNKFFKNTKKIINYFEYFYQNIPDLFEIRFDFQTLIAYIIFKSKYLYTINNRQYLNNIELLIFY